MPSDVLAILWFDTEDFVTPESDESALRIAQTLDEHRVRATFKIVGDKIRGLQARNRTDIIEALSRHDIGYHTNRHSVHPMIQEYVGNKGWDEGSKEIERREKNGVDLLKKVFGRSPSCFGHPGLAWVPQMYPVLTKWGVRVYLDEAKSIVSINDRPFWYCNMLNLLCLGPYNMALDASDGPTNRPRDWLVRMRAELVRAYSRLEADSEPGILSLFCHPTTYSTLEFWDMLNFAGGKNPKNGGYVKPRLKSDLESEEDYSNLGKLLALGARLPRLRYMTATDALRVYPDRGMVREFTGAEIEDLSRRTLHAISYQYVGHDVVISAAEIFTLVLQSLALFSRSGMLPTSTRIMQPLGPKETAGRISKPARVETAALLRACASTLKEIRTNGYLPKAFRVGRRSLSPADMFATSCLLYLAIAQGKRLDTVIKARRGKFDVGELVSDEGAKREWRHYLNKKGFKTPRQTVLARLQAWTLKPAVADLAEVAKLPKFGAH